MMKETYDFLGSNPRRNTYCAQNNVTHGNAMGNQRNGYIPKPMHQKPVEDMRDVIDDIKTTSKQRVTNGSQPKVFVSHNLSSIVKTRDIVNFLYPTGRGSKRRFPLTKSLLTYLIEIVKLNEKEKDQTFEYVVDILVDVLEDLNDPDIKEERKLRVLEETFNNEGGKDFPEDIINMYEMFYFSDNLESKQFVVACLLYDLIPLMNVHFSEIESAIQNGHTVKHVLEYQRSTAVYKNDIPMLAFYKSKAIASDLFGEDDVMRSATLQFAMIFTMLSKGDMVFDCKDTKDFLMKWYKDLDFINWGDAEINSEDDNRVYSIISMLHSIFESSSVQQSNILNVLERFVFNYEILLAMFEMGGQVAKVRKEDSDAFFF